MHSPASAWAGCQRQMRTMLKPTGSYSVARRDEEVKTPQVLAGHDSARKVFTYLYSISDEDGLFELDAATIAQQTSLSRKTVYVALKFLQRVNLVMLVEPRTGRGRHSVYKLKWAKRKLLKDSSKKSVTPPKYKDKYRTQSKDTPQGSSRVWSQSPRVGKSTEDYQGPEGSKVILVLGARFYRHIMKSIRLGLESWKLSEAHRDALEGFYGLRIDGASLSYARELRDRLWALRREIEALAASGASPRRVCSFVAGRLAGIPDRSQREVLRRTAALMGEVEQLEHRIAGLRAWLAERESDFLSGQVCRRCGYQHSEREYRSGYRDDGAGLVCFGFARVKLDELQEQAKLQRRQECCRVCGGSLQGGHIEGLCWSCYRPQAKISQRPAEPRSLWLG